MKKLAAAILALIMLLSLAACGSTPSSNAPSSTDTPASSAVSEAGNDAQSLTVWAWDPAFNIYAMKEAEKVYQATSPNFKLEVIETPWDDLQTKLTTAATSGQLGTLPDIFLCQNNAFQKNVINYPDIFYDITDSGLPFNDFAQSVVSFSVVDGKNYGVPFDNGTAIDVLRTDVLQAAGYTVADFTDITWKQYIALAENVLAKAGKPLLSSVAGEVDTVMMMLQSAGSSLFTADGTPNIAKNQELKDTIAIYKELVEKGILIEVNGWDEYIGSFTNETVAGTINGCWILGSVQSSADQSGKWGITNLPKLEGVANATNYSANGGSSWAISSNVSDPKLAVDFFAKTFAGSVPLYETILPSSGALANYLPAGKSTVYNEPQEFFGGQPIYSLITEYAGKVPSNYTGVYYYEARDAVGDAITKILQGTDMDTALQEAEDTVNFAMGK